MVVSRPSVIKFPKFTKPIMSVACGMAHALVLTADHEMYSWGSNAYRALGFGDASDVNSPKPLDILDFKG
jgi:alpha-tubulin suppressor-like RCC1 family protein